VEGFLKVELANLRKERVRLKKEMKASDPETRQILDSQQNAIKVILNSTFGVLGLKSSCYGDLISAIMITGMCRWLTTKVMQTVKDSLVETDTDGMYLDKPINAEELNKTINGWIKDRFNIDDNYLQVEDEEFGRAYFYAAKNYVLEHEDAIVIHGSSLKASRASWVADRATKLAIQHVFNGKPKEEVIAEALDFKGLKLEHFEERVKLTMEPREYDDQFEMKLLLAKQMELKTGQVGTKGTQFNYVICKTQLPLADLKPYYKSGSKNYTFIKWVNSVEELDMDHYKELVRKTLEKFGVREYVQMNLFGEVAEVVKPKNKKSKLEVVPTDEL